MIVNSGRPFERQRVAELNQRATVWQQTARRAELEASVAWERYKRAYSSKSDITRRRAKPASSGAPLAA